MPQDRRTPRPATARRSAASGRPAPERPEASGRDRFRTASRYRTDRERARYEGTPQRDLFRTLRERFIARHALGDGWSIDLGAGPGRFTRSLGGPQGRSVAFDVSREALRHPAMAGTLAVVRVRGDARTPPFRAESFRTVLAFGNLLGFAEDDGPRALAAARTLVASGGRLLVEIAPGPGERSTYLARLPPTASARLLRSPVRAVVGRVGAEGFRTEPLRRATPGSFVRWTVDQLTGPAVRDGWVVRETVAVAPSLGPALDHIATVRSDPKAWSNLLDVEETLGRAPERWRSAAALLVALERPPPTQGTK